MQETTNYKLKKYQGSDTPDLLTGYNPTIDILDAELKKANTRIDQAIAGNTLPAELSTFIAALGLTTENAQNLGNALNNFLNKKASTTNGTFNVANLASAKLTDEGYIFIPDNQ